MEISSLIKTLIDFTPTLNDFGYTHELIQDDRASYRFIGGES